MELRHTRRLYVEHRLGAHAALELRGEQAHYLFHVLRLTAGDVVRVFNGSDGEWAATVAASGKNSVALTLGEHLRQPQPAHDDVWLCAAPIKKAHYDYMLEKATELGITGFQPVLTERTQIRAFNTERARLLAIESAEQSERLDLPEMREPLTLQEFIANWQASRSLIVCAEWGEAESVAKSYAAISAGPVAILTGPEGGFSATELAQLRGVKQAHFVRLGPRILRADTAALAALANWQALRGDWQG